MKIKNALKESIIKYNNCTQREAKELLNKTCDFFHTNLLNSPDAKGALSYLEKRGITRQIIDEYKIGYFINQDYDISNHYLILFSIIFSFYFLYILL